MKNTERFSNRVDNYIRYRPHYPKEIIPFLKEKIGLNKQSIVADIGSGTGISAELFLQNGNTVYAVEPNKEMREAAEVIFKQNDKFKSINGTAEATTLKDNSIDLIIAGQAFHWFDKTESKKEFQRIAKPEAHLLLMWNDRKVEPGFLQAYEQLLLEFAIDYEKVNHRNVNTLDENTIREFFAPNPFYLKTFHNSQKFDFEGLKGRLLSSSYAPSEKHPNYKPMMRRLEQIYEQCNVDSQVEFVYDCNLYYGQITS